MRFSLHEQPKGILFMALAFGTGVILSRVHAQEPVAPEPPPPAGAAPTGSAPTGVAPTGDPPMVKPSDEPSGTSEAPETSDDLPAEAPAPEPTPAPEPPMPQTTPPPQPPPVPAPGASLFVHGGAGTPAKNTPVVLPALEAGWKKLAEGGNALDAAVAAVIALEDEPTLNAGTGSNIRMDGLTVQMDAAVMNEKGDFGAVALIERVKNPVVVARGVMNSPHLLIAGEGATRFARTMGIEDYDPRTPESRKRYEMLLGKMSNGGLGDEWKDFDWKGHWNFPTPLDEVLKPKDTVGAVVRDGRGGFAAAISTGGTSTTFYGRIGDVPIMGAGIFAGPHGAVATTGWGEYIIREMLARRVYDLMAAGESPEAAVTRGLALYPAHIGIGVIAVGVKGEFAAANTQLAWAGMTDGVLIRPDTPPEQPPEAEAPPPAPEPAPAPPPVEPAPVPEVPPESPAPATETAAPPTDPR